MDLIWITGARGFLGRHSSLFFKNRGWTVAGIGHGCWPEEQRSYWGVRYWIESDVHFRALESLNKLTGLPQIVFHAAGAGSVGQSFKEPLTDFKKTVTSTAETLEFLRRESPSTLFVFPSSAAVYGDRGPEPISEDSQPRPVSPYGFHKLIGEQLCQSAQRNFGLRCIIIRYFSLYGPELRKQILWDLACKLRDNPPTVELSGTGTETRDMIYIEDAVRLVYGLRNCNNSEMLIVNGGAGQAKTVLEIASGLIRHLGISTRLKFKGQARAGDPANYQADMTRALLLGFKPKWSLEQGLEMYVNWIKLGSSD